MQVSFLETNTMVYLETYYTKLFVRISYIIKFLDKPVFVSSILISGYFTSKSIFSPYILHFLLEYLNFI